MSVRFVQEADIACFFKLLINWAAGQSGTDRVIIEWITQH